MNNMKKTIVIIISGLTCSVLFAQEKSPINSQQPAPIQTNIGIPTTPPPPAPSLVNNTCSIVGLGGQGKVFGVRDGASVRWIRHEGCCLLNGSDAEAIKEIPGLSPCGLPLGASVATPSRNLHASPQSDLGLDQIATDSALTLRTYGRLGGQIQLLKMQKEILKAQTEIAQEKEKMKELTVRTPTPNLLTGNPLQQSSQGQIKKTETEARGVEEAKERVNHYPNVLSTSSFGNQKRAEIFLNGSKAIVKEGDILIDGTIVEKIEVSGVVFSRKGKKQAIPVQGAVISTPQQTQTNPGINQTIQMPARRVLQGS